MKLETITRMLPAVAIPTATSRWFLTLEAMDGAATSLAVAVVVVPAAVAGATTEA
jgi:hypothetical protein